MPYSYKKKKNRSIRSKRNSNKRKLSQKRHLPKKGGYKKNVSRHGGRKIKKSYKMKGGTNQNEVCINLNSLKGDTSISDIPNKLANYIVSAIASADNMDEEITDLFKAFGESDPNIKTSPLLQQIEDLKKQHAADVKEREEEKQTQEDAVKKLRDQIASLSVEGKTVKELQEKVNEYKKTNEEIASMAANAKEKALLQYENQKEDIKELNQKLVDSQRQIKEEMEKNIAATTDATKKKKLEEQLIISIQKEKEFEQGLASRQNRITELETAYRKGAHDLANLQHTHTTKVSQLENALKAIQEEAVVLDDERLDAAQTIEELKLLHAQAEAEREEKIKEANENIAALEEERLLQFEEIDVRNEEIARQENELNIAKELEELLHENVQEQAKEITDLKDTIQKERKERIEEMVVVEGAAEEDEVYGDDKYADMQKDILHDEQKLAREMKAFNEKRRLEREEEAAESD